jgi:hypothetical protein
MKFYKRLPIHRKDPMSGRFAVEADDRIVTTTAKGMQMPRGTAAQRSAPPVNGELRYNTEIGTGGELEAYINGVWEIVKTNRQATVTKQEFDNGDYADTLFGPLAYDIDVNKPENLTVYVENVPQLPGVNFNLLYSTVGSPIIATAYTTGFFNPGETELGVDSVADFNFGQVITGNFIAPGTTVVTTDPVLNTITIDQGITGAIIGGTLLTTEFAPGTYIKFSIDSLPVPNKPVITLLGLDGYCPPFEV